MEYTFREISEILGLSSAEVQEAYKSAVEKLQLACKDLSSDDDRVYHAGVGSGVFLG